jgi:hypothetical protein
VTTFWEKLQHDNPTAHILASSLDSFAAEVLAGDLKSLPTVTQALGDSWLYGAQADPIKLATFREARRVANQEVAAGRLNPSSALYDRYMRRLMKGIPSRKFAPAPRSTYYSGAVQCAQGRVNTIGAILLAASCQSSDILIVHTLNFLLGLTRHFILCGTPLRCVCLRNTNCH